MSSESDVEEYFDADDGSPIRQTAQEAGNDKEVFVTPLERVKGRAQQKQEAEKKSTDHQLRRKKLEEIRSLMSEDSSRRAQLPCIELSQAESEAHMQPPELITDTGFTNTHNNQPATHTDQAGLALATPHDVLEEKLEALSYELEQSGHLNRGHFKQFCANSEESFHTDDMTYTGYSKTCAPGSQPGLCRTTLSFDSDNCFEDATESPLFGSGDSLLCKTNQISRLDVVGLPHKELPGATSKPGPEDLAHRSNSLPDKLLTRQCDTISHQTLQEPDIIQSTKSLPQAKLANHKQLHVKETCHVRRNEPVPPPRKKKMGRSATSCLPPEAALREDIRSTSKSRSKSESSFLQTLPSGYVPFLDLCAATQGNCHVMATEDSAVKGDSQCAEGAEGPVHTEGATRQTPPHGVLFTNSLTRNESDLEEKMSFDSSTSAHTQDIEDPGVTMVTEVGSARGSDVCPQDTNPKDAEKGKSGPTTETQQVLTDKEILGQVMVTNLDTGEKMPLSDAEDKLSNTMNPLSLHIMRRTKEYSSDVTMQRGKHREGDSEEHGKVVKTVKVPKKAGRKIKKFLSKSVRKIKSELKSSKEDKNSSSDEDELVDGRRMIKIKASHSHKGPYDFDLLVPIQNLTEDSAGAVWTMKFSHCGKLLATGGQDNLLKIWVVKAGYTYFDEMRQKYSEAANVNTHVLDQLKLGGDKAEEEEDSHAPFMKSPFCVFRGHTADLLDVSWSKNYFILSSSMDKTVRLWHVSRKECLCCFQHIDFVTAIAFHPKDDRYFLSGSLDGKLRLWSIPEKKVALWNEVSGQTKLITAANFCSDGNIAVGTYDGRCVLYTADHLDYDTQIHVRSTRGKNAKGGKVTGVEPIPGDNKILVTSNDSRIRLYDLRDKTLTCKYKGSTNSSSRIKASFNHDGRYIICSSEDGCIYIWKTQHDFHNFYSVRRDRNDYWEAVKAHTTVVTAAIFAPDPSVIIKPQFQFMDADDKEMTAGVRGEVLLSADFNGAIKVFINKFKPGSG